MFPISSSPTLLQRADELLQTMTIEEKAFQLSSEDPAFNSKCLLEERHNMFGTNSP